MSTKRANDRLITVHAPFLAIAPNQNATLQFVLCTIDHVRTIVADCVDFFFFFEKKRKRNIVWEFAKTFETMNKGGKFLKKLWCCVGGSITR